MSKNYLSFFVLSLTAVSAYTNPTQPSENPSELARSEIFPPEDGIFVPLQGKIIDGRYHSPKGVFSCQAYDFDEGSYISQDVLFAHAACVSFYNSICDFKKAEILLIPGLENKHLDKNALKGTFERFGIRILEKVDYAEGIEVLNEEMVGDDNMFFAAISVEKMSVLRDANGEHMASTRGYLIFQDKDKIAVLSNQIVTLPGKKHTPKNHIEKLKQDILDFRETFEFGPIPEPSATGA